MNYKISYLISKDENNHLTKSEASARTGLSISELTLQLGKIEEALGKRVTEEGEMLFIPKLSSKQLTSLLTNYQENSMVYREEERQFLLYLLAYSQFEELSIYHFQEFLEVSKGTVLADIKKLRSKLAQEAISFDYSRKTGFFITGEELTVRRLAKNYTAKLLQTDEGRYALFYWMTQADVTRYPKIRDTLQTALGTTGLVLAPSRMEEISLFLGLTLKRMEHTAVEQLPDLKLLESLQAYQIGLFTYQQFFPEQNDRFEPAYITLVLMTILQGEIQDIQLDELLRCSAEIVHRLEILVAIQFSDFKRVLLHLFYHLVPAYFRIRNEFYLPNVFIDNVKLDYPEIFAFTKEALLPLEQLVKRKIPIEEVGFFSILFGGEITRQKEEAVAEIRGMIVCPSGISSSLILQSELKRMFPTIRFVEASSIHQLESLATDSYEVIFSTIPLESAKAVYLVRPLMSQIEKNQLINQVQSELLVPGFSLPSAQEIVKALLPYIELKEGATTEKLYQVLNKKVNNYFAKREDNRPMLTELITPEMIQISAKKMNWEEAIQVAAEPLIDYDKIEPRYVEAMIDKVKQYGPFIHIGKGIALPHARPEDGVKQIGMSLLKVTEPVHLLDDEKHEIRIFICLAAVDNKAHLRALASLTKLLSNPVNLDQLLSANTKEEILTILEKGENE